MKTVRVAIVILLFMQTAFAQVTPAQDSVSTETSAQEKPTQQTKVRKDTRPFSERIKLGGSTGFWINPNQLHVEVAVLLAYHFPKILTTGVGYRYIYIDNIFYGKNLNNYGPNLFARAQLTKRFYLWTEWENLRTEYVVRSNVTQEATVEHEYLNSFFAGIGYIRHFGKRGRHGASFQLLYNFLYDHEANSPYYSPVIYRIGYFF